MVFSRDVLGMDAAAVSAELIVRLRQDVRQTLRRAGAVVGISGGVDSSVVLALCVQAFGPKRVIGVMMPEADSSQESLTLSGKLADRFEIDTVVEEMTEALLGIGCYARRDEAIKRVFPEYDSGYRAKITLLGDVLNSDALNVFHLTIISPDGDEKSKRLNLRDYLQIVAASNFKQRSRMSMLYYHAELRNYAVVGTPNRNEHDQGFFVKWGDGGYDVAPIRHLYKTQVYQLAKHLKVPQEIRQATPTTDTYSAPSSQEEFFFRLPFETADLMSYAQKHDVPPTVVAPVMGITVEQVERVFADLTRKRRTTQYLRTLPIDYS